MGSFSGMDIGEVERIADLLDLQAKAVAAVTFVVDHTVAGLMASWVGADLDHFAGTWHQTHRPRTVGVSEQLETLVAQLRAQARDQQVASVAPSAVVAHFPGSSVDLTARDMKAFAWGSEVRDPDAGSLGLPAGWSALGRDQLKQLGLDPGMLKNRGTGQDAIVYSDGKGHYVISYGGTSGGLFSRDALEDVKGIISPWAHTVHSGQVDDAARIAHQLSSKVGADNVTLTGHSLGGRDAAAASIASGSRAVTFNSAALSNTDIEDASRIGGHSVQVAPNEVGKVLYAGGINLGEGYVRAQTDQSLVTNYSISNDIVTTLQNGAHIEFGAGDAYGQQVFVPTDTPFMWEAHGLHNYDGKI